MYQGVPDEAMHLRRWLDLGRVISAGPVVRRCCAAPEQRAVVLQLERLLDYPWCASACSRASSPCTARHYA